MPYDICEDEAALDYIEGEMARRGVTQELIDETRADTELKMLADLQKVCMILFYTKHFSVLSKIIHSILITISFL